MKVKNHINSITISVIIILGIIAIVAFGSHGYSKIIKDDILNISKLTSTNIYSEINNELTKPIFVALTMANDSFVKGWLAEEGVKPDSEIVNYLNGMKNKYGYQSVFLISDKTQKYFHYTGLHKIISKEDKHDIWFYNFINGAKLYELDVDQDEADNQLLAVFVNCKILDADNNIIGVTGVGIEMSYIQRLLYDFEDEYDLEAFLVDKNGIVQSHTNERFIEKRNINDEKLYKEIGKGLYGKTKNINVFEREGTIGEEYVISHYIEELDWYLIVRKDTSILQKSFNQLFIYDLMVTIAVLLSVLFIVSQILKRNNEQLKKMALMDSFGILENRKSFDIKLSETLSNSENNKQPISIFIIDLDYFKEVNDNYGHQQGDKVLKRVMAVCSMNLEGSIVTRWGGDEFSGIIFGNKDHAYEKLEKLRENIEKDTVLSKFGVTVSIGIAEATDVDTEDSIIKRADKSLYEAKASGRNRICISKES